MLALIISNEIYSKSMQNSEPKRVVFLHGEVKTPPISDDARIEVGKLIRQLQDGEMLSLPHSRPMPSIGRRCHELRVNDKNETWRLIYRIDPDAIVITEVFSKKTEQTPHDVIRNSQRRLTLYDQPP